MKPWSLRPAAKPASAPIPIPTTKGDSFDERIRSAHALTKIKNGSGRFQYGISPKVSRKITADPNSRSDVIALPAVRFRSIQVAANATLRERTPVNFDIKIE